MFSDAQPAVAGTTRAGGSGSLPALTRMVCHVHAAASTALDPPGAVPLVAPATAEGAQGLSFSERARSPARSQIPGRATRCGARRPSHDHPCHRSPGPQLPRESGCGDTDPAGSISPRPEFSATAWPAGNEVGRLRCYALDCPQAGELRQPPATAAPAPREAILAACPDGMEGIQAGAGPRFDQCQRGLIRGPLTMAAVVSSADPIQPSDELFEPVSDNSLMQDLVGGSDHDRRWHAYYQMWSILLASSRVAHGRPSGDHLDDPSRLAVGLAAHAQLLQGLQWHPRCGLAIEGQMLFAPYSATWTAPGQCKEPKHHRPLTPVEHWVPNLFGALYLVVLVAVLFAGQRPVTSGGTP
jgi:hypothetical protein